MTISASELEEYVVLDDFLSSDERGDLWRYFRASTFHSVHQDGWKRIFGFDNAGIVRSENLRIELTDALRLDEHKETSDCLRSLVRRILSDSHCASFIASCGGWSAMNVHTYIYPVGAGLRWHTDPDWSASFIYYAHPWWDSSWGGELMIAKRRPSMGVPREQTQVEVEPNDFQRFYSTYTAIKMHESSGGEFLFPVPNRLVLIRRGTPHCVKRVECAAGEAFRASVAGFLCPVLADS